MSVNYVERIALNCGHSAERIENGYGYDLILSTYDANGEIENGQINLQVKATDSLAVLADGTTVAFTLDRRDLDLWLREVWPVNLVLYEARSVVAYWLYVQAYFENLPDFTMDAAPSSVTVHINTSSVLDESAIRRFAQYRDNVLAQVQGVIRHDA
ncbi:MAG: DUF4365 domain-containing protein [Dehalococcoidia bacterium]